MIKKKILVPNKNYSERAASVIQKDDLLSALEFIILVIDRLKTKKQGQVQDKTTKQKH